MAATITQQTLADEFQADLADNEEEDNNLEIDIAADFGKDKMDEEEEEEINPDVKNASELVVLQNSKQVEDLMKRIESQLAKKGTPVMGSIEEEQEYQLVVESNKMTQELGNEISKLHRFVKNKYAPQFSELESLVVNPLDYARTIMRIGNEVDLTKVDLSDILPQATIMVVNVTATTTGGTRLSDEEIQKAFEGCKYILTCEEKRRKIVEFVEGRMNMIAPNLSALVGTSIAAKLMSAAGGLSALSKLPSNSIMSIGATKRTLGGFSTANIKTRAGYIYDCEVVIRSPPSMKLVATRQMVGKCTLAARVDASNADRTGSIGRAFREQVEKRLDKLMEPPPLKMPKPLAAPDDKPKKRRGGKRFRKIKQKYEMTDLRKQANRLAFGTEAQDSILSGDTEHGLGMLAASGSASGSGKLRLTAQDKGIIKKVNKQQAQQMQQHQRKFGSSGNTSGLSSSLAFTPVQGLELTNPQAAAQKIKEANQKYFGANTFKKPTPITNAMSD